MPFTFIFFLHQWYPTYVHESFWKTKIISKNSKKFKFHVLFSIHFLEWCGFELNIIEWKSIRKILGCKKFHPRNMIYNDILCLMCSILFIYCIKSRIPSINICQITFVDFQWGNGWSFIDAIWWTNFQRATLSFKSHQWETERGSVSFWGRSFSRLKNKFRHCTPPEILIFVGSLNLISGSPQREMDFVIWV
jgi:hypothetical protein